MEPRTSGIAVVKSGVPIAMILPIRLQQRIHETLGESEGSYELAVSSIASFSDVIVNSIGGSVREIETDIARILVIDVDAETRALLFLPGSLEPPEGLVEAIKETVRNTTDPKKLERSLEELLRSLYKPEVELVPPDRDESRELESLSKKGKPIRVAIAFLAPAGIPNAPIFEYGKLPCVPKPPEADPARASEIAKEIASARISSIRARVLKRRFEARKFSGGVVIRLDAPEYEQILSCYSRLRERKRLLEAFLSEFPKRVAEYISERPKEILEDLERKKALLKRLEERLKRSKIEAEEAIFMGFFSDEYARAEDVYARLRRLSEKLSGLARSLPGIPPKTLTEFLSRLSDAYERSESARRAMDSLSAELSRISEELSRIEESLKSKEPSFRASLEAELEGLRKRLSEISEAVASLEAELSRIERIKSERAKLYPEASKRARALLREVEKALKAYEDLSIGHATAAFVAYAIVKKSGVEFRVPKAYKKYKLERILEEKIDEILASYDRVDPLEANRGTFAPRLRAREGVERGVEPLLRRVRHRRDYRDSPGLEQGPEDVVLSLPRARGR